MAPVDVSDRKVEARRRVIVSDCTLREGEQQPGIVLDAQTKLAIADVLGELGVTRAEVGTPAVSPGERSAISQIVTSGAIREPLAVCRALRQDVEQAAECGVWGVVISTPVSPWQLEHKLRMRIEEMIERALDTHAHARSLGLNTFASAYDTFRTPWDSLEKIYASIAEASCADGVRVVDTVGIATPERVAELVGRIKERFPLPLEVHFHDDFGLAMANTVSAVSAGADSVSTSVAGVGERAGNAATEEIVAALEVLFGVDTGVALDRLGPLTIEIVRLLGVATAPNKSICGEGAFRHVAGLSVSGFLRSPLVAQPVEAERFGLTSEVVLGKTSGKESVAFRLNELGVSTDAISFDSLLDAVKARSEEKRGLVSDAELLALLPEHMKPMRPSHRNTRKS